MLSIREFQIINKLLTVKHSVRIKDLSEEFGVSVRTIKYDMEHIRDFLEEHNVNFCSQSNKGIWIECDEQKRVEMLNLLTKTQNETIYLDQESRIQKILINLLLKKNCDTINEIADALQVSRNTIISDMECVHSQLKESGIDLVRIPKQGYVLRGEESIIRAFYEHTVHKNLTVYDSYAITNRIKTKGKNATEFSLPEFFVTDEYIYVEHAFRQAFMHPDINLYKEDIVTMIIRMMLSIIRLKQGVCIGSTEEINDSTPQENPLYASWVEVYKSNHLPIYKDELDYVQGSFTKIQMETDITELTAALIEEISQKEQFPYGEDTTLYARLLSHLTMSFKDINSNHAENPFNKTILKNYNSLYIAVKDICKRFIGNSPLLSNESFITFIVLHFLVTQKNFEQNQKLRVIFVCATGRGAARLIEKMIESEVKEIEIVEHCSLIQVDEVIKKVRPDYIISVFPLKSHVPVIVVEPLPTKDNIKFIKQIIGERKDENLLPEKQDTLQFDFSMDDPEEKSQQVILLGLKIYDKILTENGLEIKENLKQAFLAHVMLFAHRIHFDKQYTYQSAESQSERCQRLKTILEEIYCPIEPGELEAICQYFAGQSTEQLQEEGLPRMNP